LYIKTTPLLFGIFIEQFQALLRKECPNIGVFVLNGEKLTDGTFADDMALMENTIEELQVFLECLNRFCTK
jgi:sRNA-binding regulator protein Hfq